MECVQKLNSCNSLSGSESSSPVIASCLWELAKQPELQQRLREEVTQLPNPTFDDLHGKMPYLDAVCKESYASFRRYVSSGFAC